MDLSARIDLNQRKKRVIPCYIIRDESDLSDGADVDNKLGKRERKRKRKGKKKKRKEKEKSHPIFEQLSTYGWLFIFYFDLHNP